MIKFLLETALSFIFSQGAVLAVALIFSVRTMYLLKITDTKEEGKISDSIWWSAIMMAVSWGILFNLSHKKHMEQPQNTPSIEVQEESFTSTKVTEEDKDKMLAYLYSKEKCPNYYNDDNHWRDEVN